jgi:hypothetical protein
MCPLQKFLIADLEKIPVSFFFGERVLVHLLSIRVHQRNHPEGLTYIYSREPLMKAM